MKLHQMIFVSVLGILAAVAMAEPKTDTNTPLENGSDEAPVEQSIVIKFIGARPANLLGKQVLMLSGTNMTTGRTMSLAVPNTDPNSRKMDPDPTIKDFLDEHNKGDFLELKVEVTKGKMTLTGVDEYEVKPGEDEPNVYVFDSVTDVPTRVKDKTAPAVKVTRFNTEKNFLIPQVRDPSGGGMMNKPDIAKVTDALQSGDLVEIRTVGGGATPTLKSIAVYEPPKKGTYIKLTKDTIEDRPVQAIEIEDSEDGTKTAIPIAKANVGAIIGKLRGIRTNSAVQYRTMTDDKGIMWLIDIKAAPKETSDKPLPKMKPLPKDEE